MATEREKKLAASVVNKPIPVTRKEVVTGPIVVELDNDGAIRPHYSTNGHLNKRDYTDVADNTILAALSVAVTTGIESTAEHFYSVTDASGAMADGGAPGFWLAGFNLLIFSLLKLLALWVRSNGLSLPSRIISGFFWFLKLFVK